jgi:hypothetical protein
MRIFYIYKTTKGCISPFLQEKHGSFTEPKTTKKKHRYWSLTWSAFRNWFRAGMAGTTTWQELLVGFHPMLLLLFIVLLKYGNLVESLHHQCCKESINSTQSFCTSVSGLHRILHLVFQGDTPSPPGKHNKQKQRNGVNSDCNFEKTAL